MKKSSINTTNQDQFLIKTVRAYLNNRPLFFSFIRPQEALLFHLNSNYLKTPILDFGCGDGFFASTSFSQPIHTGLDVADSRIQEAQNIDLYSKLLSYDGNSIPVKDNSYQTVVSNCVFEHLPNLKQNLSEIYRILKPSGYLLTSVMTDKWEYYLVGSKFIGKSYRQFMRRRQIHQNLLSYQEWQKVHQKAGFTIIDTIGYLPKKTAQILDISHYLSIPSLITHTILKRWVAVPNWFKLLNLDTTIANHLKQSVPCDPSTSAALFIIAKKEK